MTDTATKIVPNPQHPARYSEPILDLIGRLVADETARVGYRLRVIDPFGGVGRIHDVDADTVHGDLELGWAACRRPSVLADATVPPFRRHAFDGYVCSPAYGSRAADNHNPKDSHKACGGNGCRVCAFSGLSPRKTYRVANGGPLHPRNSGQMPWGTRYKDIHRQAWAQIPYLVRPGGLVVVNVSNHIRGGVEQPVVEWHLGQLRRSGLLFEDLYAVPTRRYRNGANRDARVAHEHVIVMRTRDRASAGLRARLAHGVGTDHGRVRRTVGPVTAAKERGPRWLEYVPLDEIVPAEKNAKAHHAPSIGASVQRFGLVETIVVDDRTGRIVAGHGRREELLRRQEAGESPPDGVTVDGEGRWLTPILRGWSSRDDDDALAAGVALNRTGELGGWAADDLADLLSDLAVTDAGLWGTGFGNEDLSALLDSLQTEDPPLVAGAGPDGGEEETGEPPPDPVSQRGDLWLLGPHRILCGDCRDPADVDRLLAGAAVNLAFTSPPYAAQRVYDESSGFLPIPPEEYVAWFAPVAANVAAHLADDGSWFVNIKPAADGLDTESYVFDLVLAHARLWGWHFATEFCWERAGAPGRPARRFKNQFEPIYQFARQEWKFRPQAVTHQSAVAIDATAGRGRGTFSSQQGQESHDAFGGMRLDGLAYPGNRLPNFAGTHEATGHTAAFPVGLPEWFVRAYTDPGDTVFDPFMGSGSTLIAAHRQGRVGYGLEISPRYTDVILARFQRLTGIVPVLESTGEPHDFCAEPAVAEPAG